MTTKDNDSLISSPKMLSKVVQSCRLKKHDNKDNKRQRFFNSFPKIVVQGCPKLLLENLTPFGRISVRRHCGRIVFSSQQEALSG